MPLTLTAITGNCEADISRFLDQFQPHVDEVIIVRAIGNQPPDKTLDIARARGCTVGEYTNAAANAIWPHVDDFSAARNKALSMATTEWCMWADIDDTQSGMETARDMLTKLPAEMSVVKTAYVLPEQEVDGNLRERFFRRASGKWINAIHENFGTFGERKQADGFTAAIKIIHSPRAERTPNGERNKRILESIPEDKRTYAHTYYLACEYARAGDARAIALAQKCLADPDSGEAERYELWLTLAAMTDNIPGKAAYYTQATTESPGRVEAWYELTALSLSSATPERAWAYAKIMHGCEPPLNKPWNHRGIWYGFWRHDLYLQAMAVFGKSIKASIIRANAIYDQQTQPIISLLHATRGRPEQAVKARTTWLRLADHPEAIDHKFGIDIDDADSLWLAGRFPALVANKGLGCVGAWNSLAQNAIGQIMVQMSDDWLPPKGWDTIIRQRMDTSKSQVLAISDGSRTDDLLCMAVLTRRRFEHQGYLFHPEFTGIYSDNYFTDRAYEDGVVVEARDVVFEHQHPAFQKGTMDATYARQNAEENYKLGAGIYNRLSRGIKTLSDVEGWCDYRDLYIALAKEIPNEGKFVEVGSWKGQSIIFLTQTLQDLGKLADVYAVDTFHGEIDQPAHSEAREKSIRSQFDANIAAAGVKDMVQTLEMTSLEASTMFGDESLDVVFIDAGHEYEDVMTDIAAWLPKVKVGGILAGHDYPHPPVWQAVTELLPTAVPTSTRCWIYQK